MVGEGVLHRAIRAMCHTYEGLEWQIHTSEVSGKWGDFLNEAVFRGLSGSATPGHDKHQAEGNSRFD